MEAINPVRDFEQVTTIKQTNGSINVIQKYASWDFMSKRQPDKTPDDMIFGVVLNRLRIERGLTFEELEEKLGFKKGYIHNATTGSGQQYLSRIPIFADFFGVSVGYMIRGEDQDRETLIKRIEELELIRVKEEFEMVNQKTLFGFLEEENNKLKEKLNGRAV